MKVRLICMLFVLFNAVVGVLAQTTDITPEVYFQEDDTIDIYADESVSITNRIDADIIENIKWRIYLRGEGFYYTTGPYKDGSFTFTPGNPSIDKVEVYDFNVNIQKLRTEADSSTTCLLDTTKVFVIRVFPKPYVNPIVRFCRDMDDNNGFQASSLRNKDAQTDGMFHLVTYASHVLRVSIPAVSDEESYWSWSIADTVLNAGVGYAYKYAFTDEDAAEDGKSNVFKIKVRNKLPYRKEAFEDEYVFECTVYPMPVAGVCNYVETYSGRTTDFCLTYSGGIKNGWIIYWTDLDLNEYTEEQMKNLCFEVDEPTEYRYRIYVRNGDEVTGFYHGVSYPTLKVWKKPVARLSNVNGSPIAKDDEVKSSYDISCNEEDEIYVSFIVDGGFESDTSWIASIDTTTAMSLGEVTCRYKVVVPDSIRNSSVDGLCNYPLYAKIQNIYTGEHYSPDSIWYSDSVRLDLHVLSRPHTPTKLVVKGNGTSGTLIAFVDSSDPYNNQADYSLVYGYEHEDGTSVAEESKSYRSNNSHRYIQFSKSILDDENNRFYVYATYRTPSGKTLVSDKCYLEREKTGDDGVGGPVYEINGRVTSQAHGIIIIQSSDGKMQKIINP